MINILFTLSQWSTERHIENKPWLYLDEMQHKMCQWCQGKVWHMLTLWQQMWGLGYSLQKAVFWARQQAQPRRAGLIHGMTERECNPPSLVYCYWWSTQARGCMKLIMGKLGVSSARLLCWMLTLIMATPSATLWLVLWLFDGFVDRACSLVEYEHGQDNNNENHGTVDIEKFEKYMKEDVMPVLGSYDLVEDNLIVIFDNASIHTSLEVQELTCHTGALLINTAPYSQSWLSWAQLTTCLVSTRHHSDTCATLMEWTGLMDMWHHFIARNSFHHS